MTMNQAWGGILPLLMILIPAWMVLLYAEAPRNAYYSWSFIKLVFFGICGAWVITLLGRWLLVPDSLQSIEGRYQLVNFIVFPVVGAICGWLGTLANAFRAPAHIRGTRVVDGREDQKAARKLLKKGHHLITLAGVAIPRKDETLHFKIIGATGTGKTTAIKALMRGARDRGARAIIADPYGRYMKHFYDPARDVVLNPFRKESAQWHLFGEFRKPLDASHLAYSLIPDTGGHVEKEWKGYARVFMESTLRQYHNARNSDDFALYKTIIGSTPEELRLMLAGTAAARFAHEANSKMLMSILSVASTAVAGLEHTAQHHSELFSIRDWVSNPRPKGGSFLFIPYTENELRALKSIISAWVRLGIFQTMELAEDQDHELWFVIDELDALGAIDGLKDATSRLRQFGGRCVIGFQSIAQVSANYGPEQAATIVENCRNSLVLNCGTSEGGGTAKFAAGLIGSKQVMHLLSSTSTSKAPILSGDRNRETEGYTEHISTEDAVMASEIEQLPDLTGFLKVASFPEWLRVSFRPNN